MGLRVYQANESLVACTAIVHDPDPPSPFRTFKVSQAVTRILSDINVNVLQDT